MSEHVWIVGVSGATRFYAALAALFPPTSQRSGCVVSRITWRSDSSAPCRASSHEHCQDFCRVPLSLATQPSKISHILAALSKKIPASKLLPEPLLLEVIQPSQQTVSRTSQPLQCFFMLFHPCPTISHHPITPPTLLKRDSVMQLSKYRQCSSTKLIIWYFTFGAIWTIFSQSHAAQRSVDFWTRPQHPRGFSWSEGW